MCIIPEFLDIDQLNACQNIRFSFKWDEATKPPFLLLFKLMIQVEFMRTTGISALFVLILQVMFDAFQASWLTEI